MSKTNLPLKEVLYGRKIVLCVTASISAYKSVSILRKLRKLGAFVSVATSAPNPSNRSLKAGITKIIITAVITKATTIIEIG